MSRQELKVAINEILDTTSDTVLTEVLEYLNSTKNNPKQKIVNSQNLKTILSEDKDLLDLLAK